MSMKRWGMPLSGILLLALLAVTLWTETVRSDSVSPSSPLLPTPESDSGRTIHDMHRAHLRTLLSWQDPVTGRFSAPDLIKGAQAQGLVYPLAVGAKLPGIDRSYRRLLLERIERGVVAALDQMDGQGKSALIGWDGKTWDEYHDPWLYLHLIRAYALVGNDLDPSVADRFQKLLRTGCEAMDRQLRSATGHDNLLLVKAVALYCAGRQWKHAGWRSTAERIIRRVIAAQHEDGYWSEHQGPVVDYNFVYLSALGIFAGETHDQQALAALQRGVRFQYQMRYPDGTGVETPDERNHYRREIREGNIGFAFCPEGIEFISQQYGLKKYLWYYLTADLLNYRRAEEPCLLKPAGTSLDREFRSRDGKIVIRRDGPWQVVVCAYTAASSDSRWIMDRQNFFSVWHRDYGLIAGGGNTKGQPRWSNFTVGATDTRHVRTFKYLPVAGQLLSGDGIGVELDYGNGRGSIDIALLDSHRCLVNYRRLDNGSEPITGHMTIVTRPGVVQRFGNGRTLDASPVAVSAEQIKNRVELNNVRLMVPDSAQVNWPVHAFNQYRQDGVGDMADARMVIGFPLTKRHQCQSVLVEVMAVARGGGQR